MATGAMGKPQCQAGRESAPVRRRIPLADRRSAPKMLPMLLHMTLQDAFYALLSEVPTFAWIALAAVAAILVFLCAKRFLRRRRNEKRNERLLAARHTRKR